MPLPVAAGLAISAGIPAVASFLGQRSANRQNLKIAREQMAFQEQMSNSAWSRGVRDMRNAGLNPMLAFQQGGASSPGGAQATMQSELGAAASSAVGAGRMASELQAIKAGIKRTNAEASLAVGREWSTVQDRAESRSRTDLYQRQADLARTQLDIFKLQLPALQNSARVEGTALGRRGAILDRIRQMIMGGRGFINPVGR